MVVGSRPAPAPFALLGRAGRGRGREGGFGDGRGSARGGGATGAEGRRAFRPTPGEGFGPLHLRWDARRGEARRGGWGPASGLLAQSRTARLRTGPRTFPLCRARPRPRLRRSQDAPTRTGPSNPGTGGTTGKRPWTPRSGAAVLTTGTRRKEGRNVKGHRVRRWALASGRAEDRRGTALRGAPRHGGPHPPSVAGSPPGRSRAPTPRATALNLRRGGGRQAAGRVVLVQGKAVTFWLKVRKRTSGSRQGRGGRWGTCKSL